MATTTTNYGFDVPTSSDLVKNGATQIALLGQDLDTFLFRPFTKNAIINGGCEVAQRGTAAVTLTAANFLYPVDRFFAGRSSGTTGATAQQINSTTLTGFNNALRVQRTAGNTATNDLYFGQSMESINSIPFAGQTVTLSFYARAGANYSAASSNLGVRLYSGTGTDQSGLGSAFTGTASPISLSQAITTSWVRYSFSATIASTATQLQFLAFYTPSGTAGAADYVDITGIQLEIGSQVSPFTRAGGGSIQQELALCRRYAYNPLYEDSGANKPLAQGYAQNTTQVQIGLKLETHMRTTPTLTVTASDFALGFSASPNATLTGLALNFSSMDSVLILGTSPLVVTNSNYFVYRPGTSSVLLLSAEL